MARFNRRFQDDSYVDEELLRKVSHAENLIPKVMPFDQRRAMAGGGPPRRIPYQEPYNEEYDYDYPPSDRPDFGERNTPEYRTDYDYNRGPPARGPDNPGRWSREQPFPRANQRSDPVNANCGELGKKDTGNLVRLRGRVQFQRLNRFISLRDSHGTTQLVTREERLDLIKRIRNIPLDSHIEVIGVVQERPSHTINTSMQTGEVEVVIEEILDVAASKRKMNELGGEEAPGRTGKKARSSTLITSSEISHCETAAVQKKFQQRTHNCGELNEAHANAEVVLCGWIDNKRSDRFVILRDGYGTAQLVINTNDVMVTRTMQRAEANSVVVVKGKVSLRPAHQRNTRMATGNIEVKVSSIEIVDPHEPVPEVDTDSKMEVQELSSSGTPTGGVNSYSARTHTCGQLRGGDVGAEVVLCGWLDSQRGNRFATIRDGHGHTQLLVPQALEKTLGQEMCSTALESVIMVVGTVCARPPEQVTEKVETGEVEVLVKKFSVLNEAKRDLPFVIREHNRPKENLRMKYRYLDLRFRDMQYRLRLRSKVLMRMREFLINQRGFVEVETPTLFRRTPGGAQEYVVPTRSEGKFYSLVQSPQQLKQLLMVGAMDRYFQVARCYRDEGARPDRQPEFTQMDIELSFADRDSIMALIEELLKASWPEDLKPLSTPFQVLTHHEAMNWYGTDKPDLSFDKKLTDISELITDEAKKSLPEELTSVRNFTAKAIVVGPNYIQKMGASVKECEELQKKNPNSKAKLVLVKCVVNRWKKALEESLPFLDTEKLKDLLGFSIPCSVVVGYGKDTDVLPLMGKLRQDVFGSGTSNIHFAWVVDFPLFVEGDDGNLESAHHPFTQPHTEDVEFLDKDPLKVRGQHFDLVLNGYEVGGGSVRIHDADTQTRVLKDILKIPVDSLEHLLEALRSGAPPHGGIALGMDRLLSIMVGADTIRDVIAFPKGVDGKDPLSGAPCDISDEEKRLYHLLPRLNTEKLT